MPDRGGNDVLVESLFHQIGMSHWPAGEFANLIEDHLKSVIQVAGFVGGASRLDQSGKSLLFGVDAQACFRSVGDDAVV